MENFNVCLLNDSFPPVIDGVANTVVNYADIIKRDHLGNPFVVTPAYPDADDTAFDYPIMRYNSINVNDLVSGYRAGIPLSGSLLNNIIEHAPDVIHTHCPVISTIIVRQLRAKLDVPVIFTYHTKFDVEIARATKMKFLQKQVSNFLVDNISSCDEIWVVSHGAEENLRDMGYEGSVIKMDNGVDFPRGRASQKDASLVTKDYDIPDGIPVFLFVGRIMWYKGIQIILDALKQLKENLDFRMVFIGKGSDSEEIQRYSDECGLHDFCIFTGAIYDREKLRAWNTRADLFLFPSTYDTNGLVVREAAACGLASLVPSGSCASEGIIDGYSGFFCEESADSMYQKLLQILKDIDHIHQVGEHAMNDIYLSWDESVHRAVERYHYVCEQKKSGKLPKRNFHLSDGFHKLSGETLYDIKHARDNFHQTMSKFKSPFHHE